MVLTALAVLLGVVLGLVRRGSFASVLAAPIRWRGVLVAGFVLQLAEHFDIPFQKLLYALGLTLLVVGTMANVHIPGAALIGIGLSANLVVFLFNSHIPIRWDALVAANDAFASVDSSTAVLNGLWEVEGPDTQLAFLGDIVPIPVTGDVVSFGDLVMLAGVVVVTMNLLLWRRKGLSADDFVDDARFRPYGVAETAPAVEGRHEVIDLAGATPVAEPPAEEYVRVLGRDEGER